MVVIMVIVSQESLIGMTYLTTIFIIMDCSEQAFTAVSDLVPIFVVMVGISQ